MKSCNQLVRNNIPNMLEELGKKFDIELLDSDKGLEFLYLNLISTIYDSFENKSLDHISEAIELLTTIAKEYGYTEQEIIDQRNKTNGDKGDFSKKILLKNIY